MNDEFPLITSKNNQYIALARQLSDDYFLAEGQKVIEIFLKYQEPEVILLPERKASLKNCYAAYYPKLRLVSDVLWPSVSSLQRPPAAIAIFKRPEQTPLTKITFINNLSVLILDCIQDPGNLGTLLRTAAASGWQHVLCLKGCTDPWNPKVVRSSAGALAALKLNTGVNITELLEFLRSKNITLYLAEAGKANSINLKSLEKNFALLLGNEGHGPSEELLMAYNQEKTKSISIPIVNQEAVESLNVSIAGAILMYKLKGLI